MTNLGSYTAENFLPFSAKFFILFLALNFCLGQNFPLPLQAVAASWGWISLATHAPTRKFLFQGGLYSLYVISFLALMMSSVLWSALPFKTFEHTATMAGYFLLALRAVQGNGKALELALSRSIIAAAVVSVLFVIVFPVYGVSLTDDGSYRWSGMGGEGGANGFGLLCSYAFALCTIIFFNHSSSSSQKSIIFIIAPICLFGLIKSGSANSFLSYFLAVSIMLLLIKNRKAHGRWFSLVLALCLGWAFYYFYFGDIVSALGRDLTFSGRDKIWAYAIAKGLERPWFGYGVEGFWHKDSPYFQDIERELSHYVPNAHNGLVQVFISLGFVGLLFFVLCLVPAIYRHVVHFSPQHRIIAISFLYAPLSNVASGNIISLSAPFLLFALGVSFSLKLKKYANHATFNLDNYRQF